MHVCFLNMPIEYYSPVSGGAVATILMETARELECDEDKERFEAKLGKIASAPVSTKRTTERKEKK